MEQQYRPEHLANMHRRGVFCLDMLAPAAQEAGMKNIIATDKYHFQQNLEAAKARVGADLHGVINDRYFISALMNRAAHIRRIEADPEHCRKYILSNLCEFDSAGRYQTLITAAVNPYAAVIQEPGEALPAEEEEEGFGGMR